MRFLATILLVVGCAAGITPAASLQTIGFTQVMKINELGDCDLSITFKLNAQQYVAWNQKYGQNKAMLKRDLGKMVSQYDTRDWKIDVQEMERKVTVGLRAYGVVKHLGGGRYEFPVPKNWKGGGKNNGTIDYNYIESIGADLVAQHQIKVVLPATAVDIKDDVGESAEPVVRYSVSVGGSHGKLLLIGGMVVLTLGLAVTALGFFGGLERLGVVKTAEQQDRTA